MITVFFVVIGVMSDDELKLTRSSSNLQVLHVCVKLYAYVVPRKILLRRPDKFLFNDSLGLSKLLVIEQTLSGYFADFTVSPNLWQVAL